MRNSLWVVIALVVVCLLAYGQAPSSRPATMQWEYKVTSYLNEGELNRLGAEGWELAGIMSPGDGVAVGLYFKRPKRNQ